MSFDLTVRDDTILKQIQSDERWGLLSEDKSLQWCTTTMNIYQEIEKKRKEGDVIYAFYDEGAWKKGKKNGFKYIYAIYEVDCQRLYVEIVYD